MVRRYTIAITLSIMAAVGLFYGVSVRAAPPPQTDNLGVALSGTGQSRTPLPDGRWLLLGGQGAKGPVGTTSLFDPSTGMTMDLPARLNEARAWHTATTLPDGSILIVGGRGSAGQPLASVERFDPATDTVTAVSMPTVTARAGHTATLLTDGRVLIAGGVDDAVQWAGGAELWDVNAQLVVPIAGGSPRASHTATLLPDGRVLLSGGSAPGHPTPEAPDVFDPVPGRITPLAEPLTDDGGVPSVTEVRPTPGTTDVPLDVRLVLRFSHPLRVTSLSDQTVVLTGPNGTVTARVVPAEDGRLVFVHPADPLQPESTYVLAVTGASDASGVVVVMPPVTFTTLKAVEPADTDTETWVPDASSAAHGWRTNRPPSSWETLAPLMAPPGATAISGRVLTLDGRPLPRVTLGAEGDTSTESDRTGRFLLVLKTMSPGRRVLQITGATASRPGHQYGFFEYGLSLTRGQTTVLPFTIWMPRLDTAREVVIPSPTTAATIITTPSIPGLELHLPAGTVIRGEDGKTVTRLGITPIPVDRPPFPLAANVDVPVYFTVQPGGAYVETPGPGPQGAWVVYPNYRGGVPGQRAQFFHYDPDVLGWYVYGPGRISPDGRQGVPDATTRFYAFTGAMFQTGNQPPVKSPPDKKKPAADPIDPSSGLFVMTKTDLYLPDVMPLALTRAYNSGDTLNRSFGVGMVNPYNMFVWSAHQYTEADLVLPDGAMIHYLRTSSGTGWTDAVFAASATPTKFFQSTLEWNGNGWDLALSDGTVYVFGVNAPLQAIRDRYGNSMTVTHTSGQSGNVTQVTSPNGRWLAFTYDTSSRVTQVTDNIGRTVGYAYDTDGNLSTVTDPATNVTTYTYDTSHQLLTITDGRHITYLTNTYANGRVATQTLADPTATYSLSYTVDGSGNITQTDVTDPRGYVERLTFNANHYVVTDVEAFGDTSARTTTIARQSGSNLITAVTDGLGRQTAYTYDSSGYVLTTTQLAGTGEAVTTTSTYEPRFHQLATVTDPLTHTWTLGYNASSALTSATDPLTHQTTVALNSAGQVTSVTDPLTHVWRFAYTGGDLTATTDPLSAVRSRFIDAAGRELAVTDPLGRVSHTAVDTLNHVTSLTDAAGGQTSYSYDANGNLLSLTDALTHATSYTYDTSDRMASRTDPLTHAALYGYDLNGNVTQFTDRKSQVTASQYDALDRLTQVTFADTSTIASTYDAGDRVTQIVDSANGTTARTYDGLDRLTEETTSQGAVDYTYDAAGRRATMTVAGQTAVNYSYDNANRLTSITQGVSVVSLTYDDGNRRNTLTYPNGIIATYGYDIANHLTSLSYSLGGTTVGNLTYAYDASGRRTSVGGSWARTNIPAALTSATYDAANRVTAWGGTSLSYDLNGNLTGDGTTTYAWTARNQLAGLSGGSSASFAYDGTGRRRGKTIGSTATVFLYDGMNSVQELSGGGTTTANLLTGLRIDETFTRADSGGTSTLLVDALGSTLELADTSGALQTHYAFEPFGATTASGATSTNAAQFTGRENDGTGVYYYRARYYSSTLQRFISEDPAGLAGGINRYAYAKNDPINRIDPSGQYDWWWHAYITVQAMTDLGYDSDAAWAMAKAVGNVDLGSQGTSADAANTHAMAGRKPNSQQPESCQQAYSGTMQQIGNDINNGNIPQALHTIQDATAPAHRGYQPWNGIPPSLAHAWSDANPGWGPINEAITNTEQFMTDYWNNPDNVNVANSLPQTPCQ